MENLLERKSKFLQKREINIFIPLVAIFIFVVIIFIIYLNFSNNFINNIGQSIDK